MTKLSLILLFIISQQSCSFVYRRAKTKHSLYMSSFIKDSNDKLRGLSSSLAEKRLMEYGKNELSLSTAKSLIELFIEQFNDRLVQILLVVVILSSALASFENSSQAFIEPAVIVAILVLNAGVGIYQTKSAEDSIDALKKLQPQKSSVLRDGVWNHSFPVSDIVPGDIISLRVGNAIPADAKLIKLKTTNFNTDEGCLTGESVTAAKFLNDESAYTANSSKEKDSNTIIGQTDMLFSGTTVTNGECIAEVIHTGLQTQIGKINQGVQEAKLTEVKTPLSQKLDEFGQQLTYIIGGICVLVWVGSINKFDSEIFSSPFQGAVYYAKTAVALGVAAIPEGLPAVVTLCLSLGASRMAKKNVIIRKLSAVETLGCTTVICTDKTGTLTTNQMTAKALLTFSSSTASNDSTSAADLMMINEYPITGVSYQPVGRVEGLAAIDTAATDTLGIQRLAQICSLCNQAELIYRPPSITDSLTNTINLPSSSSSLAGISSSNNSSNTLTSASGSFERVGEPTDAALKVLVEKMNILARQPSSSSLAPTTNTTEAVNTAMVTTDNVWKSKNDYWKSSMTKLATLEFTRDRMSMSVLCNSNDDCSNSSSNTNILLVKGAADVLLKRCKYFITEQGTVQTITDIYREQIEHKLKRLQTQSLRCLAMAYKQGSELDLLNTFTSSSSSSSSSSLFTNTSQYVEYESELVLTGIVGLMDPARPEVAESIKLCKQAGIRIIMITGDSKETAVAIAKDVNIFESDITQSQLDTCAFTTKQFFSLSESEQLKYLASGNKVFSRVEPRDKQRIVKMLKNSFNEIVGMTGDGVNDAPALQQADIGIAMGITGTDVAKNAADMILVDDNFSTIVSAVEEGRSIYSNMQCFISFLISSNIGEIMTILLATCLGIPSPLTPLHLLWVNFMTDGPPATALGFNPTDPSAMTRPPRPTGEPILSRWLFTRYLLTGVYVGSVTVGVFVWWYLDKGVTLDQLLHWNQCNADWSNFELPSSAFSTSMLNNHDDNVGVLPNNVCEIFKSSYLNEPQSMALSALISIELLKALSAISLDTSLLKLPPWKNPWLLLSVSVPLVLHLCVLYIPSLSYIFGLHPLSAEEWRVVLTVAVPILGIEEILKATGRAINKKKVF